MKALTGEITKPEPQALPAYVREELANYEEQIRKYRAGELDETKMQKLRLHFGTYAQRQEGVQMQRIKIPGGFLASCDSYVRSIYKIVDKRLNNNVIVRPPAKATERFNLPANRVIPASSTTSTSLLDQPRKAVRTLRSAKSVEQLMVMGIGQWRK